MTEAVLQSRDLTVAFGGHVAVQSVSCGFFPGQLTAIVGPNGAGKTTFFNLLSGQVRPTGGRVLLRGSDVTGLPPHRRAALGLGRGFQLTQLFPHLTLRENVRLALQAAARKAPDFLSIAGRDRVLADRAESVLADCGLAARGGDRVAILSHGDQRKLEIALLIALDPDICLLDEPTAGMSVDDMPGVLALVARLKAEPRRTILLVEHKMDVLRSLADRLIVLHQGRLLADGPPAEIMALDIVRDAYLGVAHG